MAGREILGKLTRRTSRPVATLAVFLLLLAAAGAAGLRHTLTPRPAAASTKSPAAAGAAPRAAPRPAAGRELQSDYLVIGELEGAVDVAKQTFELTERKGAGSYTSEGDGSLLPAGSFTYRRLSRSSPPNSGLISSEIELGNTTSFTFYNTRVIFVQFRNVDPNGVILGSAANSPSAGGIAFFNDGQRPADGQLGVSREFGDIAPNSTKTAVWTFSIPTSGPTFYFRAYVVADLGVTLDSVEPAAVQVTAQAGSSVRLRGRGFSGTPGVDLLNASGSLVAANLAVSNATATSLDVAIPAGTVPGVYGLRVTNAGGTPGGLGSSKLSGRLTVTAAPALGLAELLNGSGGKGPYLLSGAVSIPSALNLQPGTVIYVDAGTTVQVAGGGNLVANGGIPGVPGGDGVAAPEQIVFTAQRAPGAALPAKGSWGGINATSASAATLLMRNVVVEYGGASCGAAVDVTGSGRTLRFTDSIVRQSLGTGLKALGTGDSLAGFTRSRVADNGTSATCDAAVQVSANAALGLYGLEPTTATSVADPGFYYSSANAFVGNVVNAIQVGADSNAASNDFTKSGVLVGQGATPIQIRGSSTNPAVVGNGGPAPGAELNIGPNAWLQIAPGTDLQAGTATLFGGIAANGGPGFLQVPGQTSSASQRIVIEKVAGGGNWGALYFSPKASSSSVLKYIKLAGGHLGDGNKAAQATVPSPAALAVDAGRGIYIADRDPFDSNYSVIRFVNTSAAPVIIAGRTIAPGTIQTVAGGGLDQNGADNFPGLQANLDLVGGITLSPDKKLLYFTTGFYTKVRVLNVSPGASLSTSDPDAGAINVGGVNVRLGNVGTFFNNNSFTLSIDTRGLAVHPVTNDVYVADAGNNKVYRITPAGVITDFAGNGAATADTDLTSGQKITEAAWPGSPGPFFATGVPLLDPSAVEIDAATGTVYIADSGHGRIVKVNASGLTRVAQLGETITSGSGRRILDNPYPTGLTTFGGSLYFTNSNKHTVQRVVSTDNVVTVAGQTAIACETEDCGDGGAAAAAMFNFPTFSHDLPVVGIAADASGLYVSDQPRSPYQGRVRYINLTGAAVNVGGVTVAGNSIQKVAGAGFPRPYNGGLATSAELARPVGVAADASGNLFIAESENTNSSLRFVNRGAANVTVPDGAGGVLVRPGTIAKLNAGANAVTNVPIPVNSASLGTLQGMTFVNGLGLFVVDANSYTVSDQSLRVKAGRLLFLNTTNANQTIYPQAASVGSSPIVVPSGYIVAIAGRVSIPDAGGGSGSFATAQRLVGATDVAIHPTNGDIYVTAAYYTLTVGGGLTPGTMNSFVYRIDKNTGALTTLSLPTTKRYPGLGFDGQGRLLVASYDDNAVLRETGPGSGAFETLASVSLPRDVAVDGAGNVYVVSSGSHQIIKLAGGSAAGFAGKANSAGYSGDNGGATNAQINVTTDQIKLSTDTGRVNMTQILGITVNGNEVIFADTGNFRVRRVR